LTVNSSLPLYFPVTGSGNWRITWTAYRRQRR
jgi:hypothetical protein